MPIPLRLLVVEDSDSDDALPGRLLDHGEYDVHLERVDSAESMVTALDTAVWDLVIADLSPTGFNAAAALPLVTERGLDLPVIVVSDTVDQDEAMQMLRAGARDVLLKRDRARLLPAIERELRALAERRAQRAVEDALRRSEETVRLLFDDSVQPMWVYDLETLVVLGANDAAVAQYGCTREELLALRIVDIWPSVGVPRLLRYVRQPRASAQHWQYRLKDGQLIDMEVAAHAVHFAGRAAGLLVGEGIDAREWQPAAQQIRETLTMREQEVLGYLMRGVTSNRELAAHLVVSENTVRYHLRNILVKFHLHSRAQVVAYALRYGLVDVPGASS